MKYRGWCEEDICPKCLEKHKRHRIICYEKAKINKNLREKINNLKNNNR